VLAINPKKGIRPMPDTPPFGSYPEIPYDHMTPEQLEGYRSLIETHGQVGGPSKDLGCTTQLAKAAGLLGAHFHPGGYSLSEREREIAVCIKNLRVASSLSKKEPMANRRAF
jgi:4-carboxymuconolactone decarboxylase